MKTAFAETIVSNSAATDSSVNASLSIEELRDTEYKRLDENNQTYLDYTGGGLYGVSQLQELTELLDSNVLGNPHSVNPTSTAMTALVEAARHDVMSYFNAPSDEYDVIFTPNASGAIRLVGEAFPFSQTSCFLATFDNHNSVNGIREFARSHRSQVQYAPLQRESMRIDRDALTRALKGHSDAGTKLFAFPAQSNFSGVQHDLSWIEAAHKLGWKVMLDAAAFVPTNRLDLSHVKPDFVPLSFYKMFGFPTGIGALIARKEALADLNRPWFAGGTISLVSVQHDDWHTLLEGHSGFEDGTVNYLLLPGVSIGLRYLQRIGLDSIHERVEELTNWTLDQWSKLSHGNGALLLRIFGPRNTDRRGGTIAFAVLDDTGTPYDHRAIERLAANAGISLRTGCFCNPGAGEIAHGLTVESMREFFENDSQCSFDEFFERQRRKGNYPSTIRVSFGIASNQHDANTITNFLGRFVDQSQNEADRLAGLSQPLRTAGPDGS